jgi:hypothetical protein
MVTRNPGGAAALPLFCALLLHAQVTRELKVEYRKSDRGLYTAYIQNKHGADATAYIAQATFRYQSKQTPTAWGGDSFSYPGGGSPLPAKSTTNTNATLPMGGEPLTTGVIAVIYADGFSEGDEAVVQMMLAGRHQSYLDLTLAIDLLQQAAESKLDAAAVTRAFEQMRSRNIAEATKLDELITVPSVKHRIFMAAVPNNALAMLQGGDLQTIARAMLLQYREWQETLRNSKPSVR